MADTDTSPEPRRTADTPAADPAPSKPAGANPAFNREPAEGGRTQGVDEGEGKD